MTQDPTEPNPQNVMEPINSAPPEVKKLIQKVLKAEGDKLHTKTPRGINDDILRIVKEVVQ
ncbi:hypothetical protein [Thermoleptolyngbya sp.]